jgi:hypothetical protein
VLATVLSGGQTGVDQAALRAAAQAGLAPGGWCPPGRECDDGVIPAEFPLRETPDERSPDAPDVPRSQRTEWNVRDADAVLILGPAALEEDVGSRWAARCARRYGRPLLACDPAHPDAAARIGRWLRAEPIRVLNVAGPSERTAPGIGAATEALLRVVFGSLYS